MEEWSTFFFQTWDTLEKTHFCIDQMQRRLVKCRKRVVTQLAQNADEKLPEEWDTAVGCLVNATKLLEQQLEALEKQQVKRKKSDIKK